MIRFLPDLLSGLVMNGVRLAIRGDLSAAELRKRSRQEPDRTAAAHMMPIANALEGMTRAEAVRLAGMERQASGQPGRGEDGLVGLDAGRAMRRGEAALGRGLPRRAHVQADVRVLLVVAESPAIAPQGGSGGTLVRVGDHELNAMQAAPDEAFEERRPEGFGLAGTDAQADDLALALCVCGQGDDGRHVEDASALALLEAGGVKPQTGPFAGERMFKERADPIIDVLAQLADGGFADPGQAHGLNQVAHAPGRNAADLRFLDHGHRGLLGSRKGGKQLPCRSLGIQSCSAPSWVSSVRSRYPLRHVVRSPDRS